MATLVPVLGGEDFRGGTSPLCNVLLWIVVSWLLSSVPPRETIWDRDRPSFTRITATIIRRHRACISQLKVDTACVGRVKYTWGPPRATLSQNIFAVSAAVDRLLARY